MNSTLSRSYDVYGAVRHSTGAGVTRMGFTGELQDAMTELVYLRARHYHPVLGRFLQRDSFAGFNVRPQSLNRYAYGRIIRSILSIQAVTLLSS